MSYIFYKKLVVTASVILCNVISESSYCPYGTQCSLLLAYRTFICIIGKI